MKKLFLLIALMMPIASIAQDKVAENSQSKSKTLEFLEKDGSFIQKEFYPLGKVKGVECEVLILTNLLNKQKMGCLRLKTTYYNRVGGNDTYIGTLDSDELSASVQSLQFIKDQLMPTNPSTYTEAEYKTRDGVKLGAYSSDKGWKSYVYTKGYTSRSAEFFDASHIDSLIGYLNQAKDMITQEVGK